MNYLRTSGAIAAVLFFMPGCTTHEDLLREAHARHLLASNAYIDSQYHSAMVGWRQAIAALEPGSSNYYAGRLYVEHAEYQSNIALASLRTDQPIVARSEFLEVPSVLSNGFDGHRQYISDQNDRDLALGLFFTALTLGAGAYASANAETYEAQQHIADMTARNMQTIIENMDFDDPSAIRDVGPTDVDRDFVRMPFFPNVGHMSALGRVAVSGGHCTGAFVRPRIVLTAAHCVFDQSMRRLRPSEVRFEQWSFTPKESFLANRPYKVFTTSEIVVPDTYTHPGDWADDWALILTNESTGNTFGWVSSDLALQAGDTLAIGGYSADTNEGRIMTLDYGCPLERKSARNVLQYACKTFGGASGAPILLAEGEHRLRRVVGVHVCGRRLDVQQSRARTREDSAACGVGSENFIPALVELRRRIGDV